MSSNLLADLDSFYRQQSSTVDGKTHDNEEEDWGDFQESQTFTSERHSSIGGELFHNNQVLSCKPRNADLLYDAVDELEDLRNSRKPPAEPARSKVSILYTEDRTSPNSIEHYDRTTNKEELNNDLLVSTSKTPPNLSKATSTVTKPGSTPKSVNLLGGEEEWDDFAITPAVQKASNLTQPVNIKGQNDNISQSQSHVSEPEIPPANVPPPALLLTLFLQVINQHKSELLRLANSSKGQHSQIVDEKDAEFLRAYVETARVLARIIAGRKLRWKRDHLLSQNMKIGPASTKRATGMKLASIDKAEIGKEEKEVLDIVEVWRKEVGRLRAIVTAFTMNGFDKIGAIPDIQPNIPVKVLRENEGGISSIRPCALCGLKRNERINKIDVSVHDSFGEWWNESTSMHRTCKYFWQSHRFKLQTS